MSRKYFNEGMAKEACEWFDVRAKQLSRVLTGVEKYLGGTQARKRKAHRRAGQKREDRWLKGHDMTRHTTTQHNTDYVISSVHTAKNNHKSVTAQSSHHLVSSAPVPVQVATRRGSLNDFPHVTTRSCLSPPPEPCVTVCHTR